MPDAHLFQQPSALFAEGMPVAPQQIADYIRSIPDHPPFSLPPEEKFPHQEEILAFQRAAMRSLDAVVGRHHLAMTVVVDDPAVLQSLVGVATMYYHAVIGVMPHVGDARTLR